MTVYDAAEVLAFELNKEPWEAKADLDEVFWTTENGDRFKLVVEYADEP